MASTSPTAITRAARAVLAVVGAQVCLDLANGTTVYGRIVENDLASVTLEPWGLNRRMTFALDEIGSAEILQGRSWGFYSETARQQRARFSSRKFARRRAT